MKIAPFTPVNTLIKGVKVSPTYVAQEEVNLTADALIQGLNTGTVIKTTFTGLQIQTMGSTPLDLNVPKNFIPIQMTIFLSNTTTPFDFGVGDTAVISCGVLFTSGVEIQNIIDNNPYVLRYNQAGRPLNHPYILTTELGGDATEGDSTVDVYAFGYYI